MSYLETLPRRLVTLYLPLSIIVIVLMFPFYWMALTSIKPDEQLLALDKFNPFWTWQPTIKHIQKLLFETNYPLWLWNTMMVAISATVLSIFASVGAAYAIVRLRYRGSQWVGAGIFLAYLVPPSILFIPLSTIVFQYGLFDTPFALILTYPTILIPFSTWLLMGYFKTIPYELEECALIDGASRMQILTKIVLPLAVPGLISAFIFCFTLCWNEFIYALTFIDSAGRALRLLRRALRLGHDRSGEGIARGAQSGVAARDRLRCGQRLIQASTTPISRNSIPS
jgi:multiple sugar transport system permease protein